MAIYLASNAAQLKSLLTKASGGDEIRLAPGDYGDIGIARAKFASEVTITAQDDANPPRFNTVSLSGCTNLAFENINFHMVPTATTVEWSTSLRADGSSNISVRDSTFTGGNAVAGIDSDSAPGTQGSKGIMDYPIGRAMTFIGCDGITIEDNVVRNFTDAVSFSRVNGIEMNRNDISDFRQVPVGGGDVSNVSMDGNYFHDAKPWKFGEFGDHGDFVHFWTTPQQIGPSENFSFTNNYLAQGNGAAILGIYLDDNDNNRGFRDVLIEGNVIHNGNGQSLRMEDVDGLEITGNTFLQSSGDVNDAPRIYLADGTRNVVIDNNVLAGVDGPAMDNSEGNNIILSDNVIVQIHDATAPNYVGNLFTNGLADNPTLEDLKAIPGSLADGKGSELTHMEDTGGFDGILLETRGEGLELSTHSFSVIDAFEPGNQTLLQGAVVTWDFGDGKEGVGNDFSHSYDKAGTYITTATIKLANGVEHYLTRTVEVLSPMSLRADFDRGFSDSSDDPLETTVIGTVSLVDSDRGQSIRLDAANSTVEFNATEDLLGNDEFTLSFGFQKDAGAEDLGGRLLYFLGTAVVDVGADSLSLRGSTSVGEPIVLSASGVGINDSDWHQITYVASKDDGTAILYLDGQEVARISGLEGGQFTNMGWDLHLGSPFGDNFKGLLDDVSFTRAALNTDQVQKSYESFQQGEIALPSDLLGEDPVPTSITVSTLSDLYNALAGATGGETILLASGDYGDMLLTPESGVDITFPSNVTITSADPDNPASFSGLDIRGAANLTFDGVVFDYTFVQADPAWTSPFSVLGSQDVAIRNCTFDGDVANGVSADADGYGTGIGLLVSDSANVAVENNEVYNFYLGMVITESDGLVVAGNDLHSIRSDGLNFAEVTNVVIEENYIHDFKTSPNSLDHCDMIQFWTNGTDEPSSNIIIRSNWLDIGEGGATQSIFMRNEEVDQGLAGPDMFYQNVTIENNVIVNGQAHGITVGETSGLIIRGNSVLHADGGLVDGADASVEIPKINLTSASTDVLVEQNATGGLTGWTGQADWTVNGNAFVQDQNAQAPGWYGDVFVTSSLDAENGVHDFVVLPGGMIDRLGAGADLPAPVETPVDLSVDFQVTPHETYLQTHLFDAGVYDLPEGTIYQWSFGDGTQAEGRQVVHSFEDGGAYDVTLTVQLPDGTTASETSQVAVQGLEVLSLGEDGKFRAYDAGHEILLATNAGPADGIQLGAKGLTASVERAHVTDMLGVDDFSISMELTADSAQSAGEVFRLHGSIVANVTTQGELMLRVSPTVGAMVTITTKGAKLNDLATHDVDIRMHDGQMQVWIDGSMSTTKDLAGPLANSGAHNLTFGNMWGQANFNGDLTRFQIEVGDASPIWKEHTVSLDRFDFLDNHASSAFHLAASV